MVSTNGRYMTVRGIGLIAAVFALFTAILASAIPAHAANGTASLTKTQFLTSAPVQGGGQSEGTRSIFLAAGEYGWSQINGAGTTSNGTLASENIRLKAATYTWDVILVQGNGFYTQYSLLCLPGSGGCATLTTTHVRVPTSKTAQWGDILQQE